MVVLAIIGAAFVLTFVIGIVLRMLAKAAIVMAILIVAGFAIHAYQGRFGPGPQSQRGDVTFSFVLFSPGKLVVDVVNQGESPASRISLDCSYARDGATAHRVSETARGAVHPGHQARITLRMDPPFPASTSVRDVSCQPRFRAAEDAG